MVTILRATAAQNVFKSVWDDLQQNIVDPRDRNKQWIFSELPDFDTRQELGFPILVVKEDVDGDHNTMDNKLPDLGAEVVIEIYSVLNSQTRSLIDSIRARLNDTNFPQFDFRRYREDKGNVVLNAQEVHVRTITQEVELMNIDQS